MDGHCLSPYTCKPCSAFKFFDGLNFDCLTGWHQKCKSFPHQNFVYNMVYISNSLTTYSYYVSTWRSCMLKKITVIDHYLSVATRRKALPAILAVSSSTICLSSTQISTGILCFNNDLERFFIQTKWWQNFSDVICHNNVYNLISVHCIRVFNDSTLNTLHKSCTKLCNNDDPSSVNLTKQYWSVTLVTLPVARHNTNN